MRIDCEEEAILGGTLGLAGVLGFITLLIKLVTKITIIEAGLYFAVGLGYWWWLSRRNKWDFWEWADVIIPSGLLFGMVINLSIGPGRSVSAGGYLIAWIISRIVSKNYRKLKWYLSGRIGLGGLSGILIWSLFQMVVDIWKGNGIYWVGLTINQWLSILLFTVSATAIYLRSGRKITKDLPFL